jgi:hypothetical protein
MLADEVGLAALDPAGCRNHDWKAEVFLRS